MHYKNEYYSTVIAVIVSKVDIKCIKPGEGQYYYPAHLPVLGKTVQDSTPDQASVSSGDMVRVQLDLDMFKALQEGHGGWNDQMAGVTHVLMYCYYYCVLVAI